MKDQSLWYLENIDVTGIFCPNKMGAHKDTVLHKNFAKGEYIYMPEEMAEKILADFYRGEEEEAGEASPLKVRVMKGRMCVVSLLAVF